MSRLVWIACCAFLPTSAASTQESLPSDAEIRSVVAERVEAQGDGIGIVVGIIGAPGRRVISHGRLSAESPALDGDTVFEIGSLTKVFTALLLADMVRDGTVALIDPVSALLPTDVRVPQKDGRQITLIDLATHTAGLPMMPDDFPPFSDVGAKQYSVAALYRSLSRVELTQDVGTAHRYSNVGYSLLGHALAARDGGAYEDVLRSRVLDPLNLPSTAFTVTPSLRRRLAAGHDAVSGRAIAFSFPMLVPAGGLVSTANDLLVFLANVLGYETSPLSPALTAMLATRRPAAQEGNAQALGWMITGDDAEELIYHDGGTLGHASSVAWDPERRIGIVVLSNSVVSVGDIARHLLWPTLPLAEPTITNQVEISVDPAILSGHAGRYEAEGGPFLVALDGEFLTIELPASWGLPRLRMRAAGPRDFFTAELPIRIAFQPDSSGRTSSVLIYPPRAEQGILAVRRGL